MNIVARLLGVHVSALRLSPKDPIHILTMYAPGTLSLVSCEPVLAKYLQKGFRCKDLSSETSTRRVVRIIEVQTRGDIPAEALREIEAEIIESEIRYRNRKKQLIKVNPDLAKIYEPIGMAEYLDALWEDAEYEDNDTS